MRKFKLVREYPQSPLKDTIVTKDIHGQYVAENPLLIFQRIDIELYPEFWQEVKEKFPKIISFRRISDKMLYTLGRYDLYWGKEVIGGYTLDVMITQGKNTNYTEIYQVAVSETEVFTLGDRVKYYGEVCNLTNIYFNEHNQLSFRTNVKSLTVPKTGVFDLDVKYNKIKKAPEPLFVTEDGIEVFGGDFHFSVNKKTLTLADNGTAQIGNSASHKDVWWTFSTKELAEKYIDENKLIYSKKQIREASNELKPLYETINFRIIPGVDVTAFNQKLNL